jgi:hypothetical protein
MLTIAVRKTEICKILFRSSFDARRTLIPDVSSPSR